MPAKDLGSKHVCFKCSTKFYDLKKPDPICPKCGSDQREATAKPEGRRSRLSAVPKIIEPIETPEKSEDAEDEIEDVEDEEAEEDEEP
ncbi:MAG: FYDLN acid domain-containing protein [Archangium sp.]|nr:FYDLN acid domain-containing protein [Archangium sp.]